MDQFYDINESFSLHPFGEVGFLEDASILYDPNFYFKDDTEYIKQMYTEGTAGTTKKNLFSRLFGLIIKSLKHISFNLGKMFKWLSNIFKSKKVLATIDQILEDINVQPKEDNNQLSTDGEVKNGGKVISIPIPSNERSEVQVDDKIDVMFKDFIMKFDKDRKTVNLDFTRIKKDIMDGNYGKVKGQGAARTANILDIARLLVNREHMTRLLELGQMIHDNKTIDDTFVSKYKLFRQKFDSQLILIFTIQLDSIVTLQNDINKLIELISPFSMADNNEYVFKDRAALEWANQFCTFCEVLQFSMNAFSSTLKGSYTVDGRYYETINDVGALAEFVSKSIKAGIPPKYIGYNCYLMSSKEIKGDGSNGNENAPCWGQSRLVLFPTNTPNVHKIALSGLGIESNRTEVAVSNEFRKHQGENLITLVTGKTSNYAIIDSEKVQNNRRVESFDIMSLKAKLNAFTSRFKIPIDVTDVHERNVGYKNGQLVCLDYGFSSRNYNNNNVSGRTVDHVV